MPPLASPVSPGYIWDMRRAFRILLLIVLLLAVMAAGAFAFLPWKDYAAPWIAGQLRARGLPVAALRLEGIGMAGVRLREVTLDMSPPLVLPEVTLDWDIADPASPQLNALTLRGLRYDIPAGPEEEGAPAASPAMALPVDPAFFAQVPLAQVRIEDAQLGMHGHGIQWALPFSGTLSLSPIPRLELTSDVAQLTYAQTRLEAKSIALALTLNAEKKRWEGTLRIASLADTGETAMLPALTPEVTLTLAAQTLTAKAVSGEYRSDAAYDMQRKRVTISNLSLPLAGGTVRAAPFTYAAGAPLAADFTLTGINLQTALALLMDKTDVMAAGTLDGTVPVRFKDGVVSLGAGQLTAREGGTLALSGDSLHALAGAGGQAGDVAQLLGDFHFNLLALELAPAGNDEVVARLRLEGNNPSVYDGKRVHLNVTLQGDVMKSLRSSLQLLDAPQDWIEKEMKDQR